MKKFIYVIAFLFAGSVNAAVINFEDVTGVVTDQYQGLGVNFTNFGSASVFGGISNGDPGSWSLEGTNGPSFYGIQAGATIGILFDSIISDFALDTSRSNGSQDTNTFTLTALLDSSVVSSQTIIQGAINDWTTVSFSGFAFDQVQLTSGDGTRPVYGIDNISFNVSAVPEPSTLALMALGLAGIGFAARRRQA